MAARLGLSHTLRPIGRPKKLTAFPKNLEDSEANKTAGDWLPKTATLGSKESEITMLRARWHFLNRRLLLLAMLVALVLLGVGGWLAFGPERIRRGMTRDEVETILGPPDGRMLAIGDRKIEDVMLVWKDRRIVIEFDELNRVREVTRPPSLFDNLRGTFGF
jgi:hypothetical protein